MNEQEKQMKKQIEEMAQLIYDNRPVPQIWNEDAESIATTLYNAGWRKRGEVAKEIFEDIELLINKAIYDWRNERKFAYNDRQIEMIDFRNGAFRFCLHEIAKLKKKYTVGATDEKAET